MVSGELHEPVAVSPPPKVPRYSLKRRPCGLQRWSGGFEEKWGLRAGLEVLVKNGGSELVWRFWRKIGASELVWWSWWKMGPHSWSGGLGEKWGLRAGLVVLVKNGASELVWRFWRKIGASELVWWSWWKMGPQSWSGGLGEKWGLGAGLVILKKNRSLRAGLVVLVKNGASELVWWFWWKMGPRSWSGGFGEK